MLASSMLVGLLLLVEASAQISTKSYVTCVTKQGPKSTASVKTTSQILTLPWYVWKITTTTPHSTITPPPSTSTISSTITVTTTLNLPTETDTFTDIVTNVVIISSDVFVPTTVYSTNIQTVYTTETTTIAASAGFIPLESSRPGSQKRAAEGALEVRVQSKRNSYQIAMKNGKPSCSPAMYPQGVVCAGLVAVISTTIRTKTATKTATITAPTPTVTVTNLVTDTATATLNPIHASTTVEQIVLVITISFNLVPTTATIIESQTVTVAAPQATFYEACADNNIITRVNGRGINAVNHDASDTYSSIFTTSAYDCCVACLNTAKCGGSAFANGFCLVYQQTEAVCSQANFAFGIMPGNAVFSVSNGYCGYTGLCDENGNNCVA